MLLLFIGPADSAVSVEVAAFVVVVVTIVAATVSGASFVGVVVVFW